MYRKRSPHPPSRGQALRGEDGRSPIASVDQLLRHFQAMPHARPNALAHWARLSAELAGRRPALFLDFDGTLTPIVERPEAARLDEGMHATLTAVSRVLPTVIVTGRGLDDARARIGLDDLVIAASHGFDVAGPPGSGIRLVVDPEIEPVMVEAETRLRQRTAHIPGVIVESKRFSVAVHYRLTPRDLVAGVDAIVTATATELPGVRKARGKEVFELRPALDWDKGRAVLWLLDHLPLDRSATVPIYIGDDVTDEDAFRAIAERGIGIVVTEEPRPTAARYALRDVEEVRRFLDRLAGAFSTASSGRSA